MLHPVSQLFPFSMIIFHLCHHSILYFIDFEILNNQKYDIKCNCEIVTNMDK